MRTLRHLLGLAAPLAVLAGGCNLIIGAEPATLDPDLCDGPGYAVLCHHVGTGSTTSSSHASGSATASTTASTASATATTSTTGTGGAGTGGAATSTGTGGAGTTPNGSTCQMDDDCASGACVEGLCCATACPDFGADKCVQNGACKPDGSGCAYYTAGTPCANATCSGGVITTSACDGNGFCKADQPTPCDGNYACADANTCKATCAVNADCASTLYACSNVVVGECLLAHGEPCIMGDQCASDGCANGFCQ